MNINEASDEATAAIPLKRHTMQHIATLARTRRSVGLFSETPFESIHALVNAIERRYLSIVDRIQRDKSLRQALAARQDHEARESRAKFLESRKRKSRS
jgi:hypothetical protein